MRKKFGEAFSSLGAPALRALESVGIGSLEDSTRFTEKELLALHGFGPKALRVLSDTLQQRGLSFRNNKR